MSIVFFTDPHIGVNRVSHTTVASRERLKQAVFTHALKAVNVRHTLEAGTPAVCLGDLFDTESNSEAVIAQGAAIARQCEHVLAGNHDLPGREGKISSLQLLDACLGGKSPIVMAKGETLKGTITSMEEALLFLIPHLSTQEQFKAGLNEMEQAARELGDGRTTVLCLHCNYDSPFVHNDASLNLPMHRAEELLKTFDYVLLGHEHTPRELHGDRLIILGNTHPTSFSDISDKFAWVFEGGTLTKHRLWSIEDGLRTLDWEQLLQGAELPDTVNFVDVIGSAPSARLPEIAGKVAGLWKAYPELLMVRNQVEASDLSPALPEAAQHRALDLPTKVSQALEGTDLLPLWNFYLEKIQ